MAIQTFTLAGDAGNCTFKVMNVTPLNQQWGRDDSRVTVEYKIPWASRFVARSLLLGTTSRVDRGANAYLHRNLPHAWIEDGANQLYATKITDTRGLGTKTEPVCYDEAAIKVQYEGLPFEVVNDESLPSVNGVPDEGSLKRYVELGERSTEGRIIQSYGSGMVFAGTTRGVANGWPFPYYEETFSLVWHEVPLACVPWTTISGMMNKMNSAAFGLQTLCGVYPLRTLLFIGCQPTFTRLSDDKLTRAVNLKFKFKYNRFRWDYLPDPKFSNTWTRVVSSKDAAKTLFEEDDFTKLFRPA